MTKQEFREWVDGFKSIVDAVLNGKIDESGDSLDAAIGMITRQFGGYLYDSVRDVVEKQQTEREKLSIFFQHVIREMEEIHEEM